MSEEPEYTKWSSLLTGSNPFGRNFAIDEEHYGITRNEKNEVVRSKDPRADKITRIKEDFGFKDLADVFLFAMCIGKYVDSPRKKLKKAYANITTKALTIDEHWLIIATCLDDLIAEKKKDNPEIEIDLVDIFEDDKNIAIIKRIAQEYASMGMIHLTFALYEDRGWKKYSEQIVEDNE